MVLLLSVPHTGTRYTLRFLESIGVHARQYHSEPPSYEDLQWEKGKAIIPLRDPALQFTSMHFRAKLRAPEKTLKYCVTCWSLLIRLENLLIEVDDVEQKRFQVDYLRLSADQQTELERIARFCGTELKTKYESSPVGSYLDDPIGYDIWDEHKTPEIEEALKPYREHYGYYP